MSAKKYCDELYELVFQTKHGRVFRNGINKRVYMVEFGNMFINLTCCNLNRLAEFVNKADDNDIDKMIIPSINKIVLQPMKSLGCYAFTLEEFLELRVLLEESKALLELENEVQYILNSEK